MAPERVLDLECDACRLLERRPGGCQGRIQVGTDGDHHFSGAEGADR